MDMKTAGIIAEYNPFHNGHRYQIRKARELTGADYVVVVMSGDFVQRGEPSVFDKYTRTAMALDGGADLVLEMPVRFATSSAEDFAACGVSLLDRLGVIDVLCFGSELGRLEKLEQAAKLLVAEPETFREELRRGLAAGHSFPRAREMALEKVMKSDCPEGINQGSGDGNDDRHRSQTQKEPLQTVLSSPNNILGIEYLKALKRRNSRIRPLTIRREGQGYHDTALPEGEDLLFPSASAIRRAIREGTMAGFWDSQPSPVPIFPDDLSLLLNARLLELCSQNQDLTVFSDVSPELASRIRRDLLEFDTFSGRILRLKTRQLTYTRISRALIHILLGITGEEVSRSRSLDYAPYLRILGFRRAAAPLLGRIRRQSSLPMVTRTAGTARQLTDPLALDMLRQDFYASHVYQSLVFHKSGEPMKNEYTRSVIIG